MVLDPGQVQPNEKQADHGPGDCPGQAKHHGEEGAAYRGDETHGDTHQGRAEHCPHCGVIIIFFINIIIIVIIIIRTLSFVNVLRALI